MPTYTLELSNDEQLTLDYEVERLQALPVPGGEAATLTREQVLAQHVQEWLSLLAPHLMATLTPLMSMLESAPPAMRSALIAGVRQAYIRSYLTRKYGGMA